MTNFADRLSNACKEKKSIACVGLDPRVEKLPGKLVKGNSDKDIAEATGIFCKEIIGAVCDIVPVVKPNIAFFEALGVEGIKVYSSICKEAQDKGLLVIGDVKRGDIGTTAECYARGLLGEGGDALLANHDAITLNAYLGSDGIKPFIEKAKENGQGMFLLVKTSNPSSAEL
ncbi:MAG: orotidine-5'-phosphate decarboxylase, partial [Planctomycetota bacterium]